MLRYSLVSIAAILLLGATVALGQDIAIFQCEDLKSAGVVLVPVTSPDYGPLFNDIQNRIDNPPAGLSIPERLRKMMFGRISPEKRSTSAILLNQSGKSIAATALIWRYEDVNGRTYDRSTTNIFGKDLLLPSLYSGPSVKVQAYWYTIMPGSKRYLGEGEMAGDNTDVRLPGPDEMLTGGGGLGGGAGGKGPVPIKSVTLIVDGVFFTDGTFAGPDNLRLWDAVTMEAKARRDIAKMARDGKDRGSAAAETLGRIGAALVDQPAERVLASEIARQRQMLGDQGTVDKLAAQADLVLPDFRRI